MLYPLETVMVMFCLFDIILNYEIEDNEEEEFICATIVN